MKPRWCEEHEREFWIVCELCHLEQMAETIREITRRRLLTPRRPA